MLWEMCKKKSGISTLLAFSGRIETEQNFYIYIIINYRSEKGIWDFRWVDFHNFWTDQVWIPRNVQCEMGFEGW